MPESQGVTCQLLFRKSAAQRWESSYATLCLQRGNIYAVHSTAQSIGDASLAVCAYVLARADGVWTILLCPLSRYTGCLLSPSPTALHQL